MQSEVLYTDINPDIVLNEFNSSILLDLNEDGINDFHFLNWNKQFRSYNSYGEPMDYFDLFVQWVGPAYLGNNRIAAQTYFDYNYGIGIFVYYYPFALESGASISPDLNFNPSWLYQSMAKKTYTDASSMPRLFDIEGYWAPGADEKFLGIYFEDSEYNMHYGWIRCSIIDSAEGIIIHDFAYETEPEKSILAGATFSDPEPLIESNFTLYAHNNVLFLYANVDTLAGVFLDVFDVQGNMVFTKGITNHFNQIPLDLPPATYITRLRVNGHIVKSAKILF
ncbi:MAG TPA: hypothetical protein PKL06_02330 [Chitinophagales bacterium]|nr:hypothetical protein [Chitinophagales bacterium]